MKKRKMKIRNKRKHIKLLPIIVISIFMFSFCYTLKYFSKSINNESFLKMLLKNGNSHMEIKEDNNLFSKMISFIADVELNNPTTLLKNNYVLTDVITSSDDEQELESLPTNYIEDPYKEEKITNPLVYLYNTHQSEEYASNHLESYNVKPTVMMTSYILREKLNNNGIPTIVEENNVTEFLRTNNWSYSSSYKVTKLLMEDAKSKNEGLKYFIDLHRDSVKKSISTATIDNKKYAKILFIVGLENKNYQSNLSITEKLNNSFNEKYPGLSRGIYKKQGAGVNGVYNQDFSPNTILIEVGGVENTIDEVYNTCEAISVVLTEYIKGVENE